jgi:ABC-type multidrug transport system fused ATPase/permease subunit
VELALAGGVAHQHRGPAEAVHQADLLQYSSRHAERYIWATVLDFLAYQFTIITPMIIFFICSMLEDPPENMNSWCVFWMIITPLCRFLRSFFDAHGTYQLGVIGCDVANCVALGMVNKSLKYSTLCNKKFKMGEISSLMQVDCFRLSLYPKSLNGMIFVSYSLVYSIVFMAVLVHYAFLAGFGVLLIASIANMIISRSTTKFTKELATATDNRMKITNEVFNNVKFVKVNAWEEYFYDKLIKRRSEEVNWIHRKFMGEAYSTLSMWLTPKLVLAAIFGTFVAMGGPLNPPVAFAVMNLYGYIQFYLQFLPNYISVVIEGNNGIKRIQAFLQAEEINTSCITYNQYEPDRPNSIEVENGSFYWDKETENGVAVETPLTLTDMNFTVKRGEIVAIIGDIGSGKSSLMYSLLGEMKFKENLPRPRVAVNGTLSLVTQKPWIVNDTVMNNILFGKPYNKKKYEDTIHYACLKRDFELFTHGDKTMIGEKGATLSGGQKARISFARALYSESDILLLDDLLSAVDVHVGKFLMTETLLQYSRSKTRVLITHALYYLKYVDKVLILENGRIVEQGNYEMIRNSNRFKDIYSNMMKDEKKARSDSINLLEIEAAEKDEGEDLNEDEKILAEVIKEASIHTKKSRTQTAIDREKLEKLRAKKSEHPKQAAKAEEKKPDAVAPSENELMMAEEDGG